MTAFAGWIKKHKFLVLVALVISFILYNSLNRQSPYLQQTSVTESIGPDAGYNVGMSAPADRSFVPQGGISYPAYQKVSTSSDRLVIKESNLSLLVKDVRQTGDNIVSTAKQMGGYMVSVSYNNPSEQAFATVTVRVPTDRLDDALNQFRSSAIKVINENLNGTDVTQEYQDLDQRVATLRATKTKFDEILKRATTVDEILRVNTEIINLESQIDQATSQKMALADNARLTKITLFLSTDELALPYTPDEAFRPDVVFKLAVRSLLSTLQNFAELFIWLGVYAVIWLPVLLFVVFLKRRGQKPVSRSTPSPSEKN